MKHSHKSSFKAVQGITSRMLRSMEGVLKLASAWGARAGRDGGGAQGHRGNGELERKAHGGKRMEKVGGRVGGDSTHLLRRFSAHALGYGLLNV